VPRKEAAPAACIVGGAEAGRLVGVVLVSGPRHDPEFLLARECGEERPREADGDELVLLPVDDEDGAGDAAGRGEGVEVGERKARRPPGPGDGDPDRKRDEEARETGGE